MKKFSCFLLLASCLMLLASCSKGAQSVTSLDPKAVVATIGDVGITASELDEAVKGRLQRVEQEIYEIKKGVLDDLVEKKIIEQAASKDGKSVGDYLKANVDDKATPPTDEEVKSFYDARKDQMGGKPFKDMQNQVKGYLTEAKKQGARQQLLASLRSSANIKINLQPPRIDIEAGDNPSIGPKGAPITIIEFTDYQCPFCSRVRATMNQVIGEYKDQVRYVLRDFPLSFHQFAKKAHEAAHCAGDQGKYWDYNKELWANQQTLQPDKLKEYAKKLKLNSGKFDKCLDSGKYTKKVEENVEYGMSVGAQGTPSFFVNGIFISGARPFGDFKKIIDQELKK